MKYENISAIFFFFSFLYFFYKMVLKSFTSITSGQRNNVIIILMSITAKTLKEVQIKAAKINAKIKQKFRHQAHS